LEIEGAPEAEARILTPDQDDIKVMALPPVVEDLEPALNDPCPSCVPTENADVVDDLSMVSKSEDSSHRHRPQLNNLDRSYTIKSEP